MGFHGTVALGILGAGTPFRQFLRGREATQPHEDSQSTGILVGAVGIEPACERQLKDLTSTAGKFESLQVLDKQQSDSWNQFLGLTK
jgi:hypothetical protein